MFTRFSRATWESIWESAVESIGESIIAIQLRYSTILCNFAVPFTKSGMLMDKVIVCKVATKAKVQNCSFKENWKSTQ